MDSTLHTIIIRQDMMMIISQDGMRVNATENQVVIVYSFISFEKPKVG
jgi:hypothetical protein